MIRAAKAEVNRVHFWCPGCNNAHGIHTNPGGWSFNNDLKNPTFSPSVLVGGVQWPIDSEFHKPNHSSKPGESIVCHSFVTDGHIQFLSDSTHALSGATVELPSWPYTELEA